MENASTKVTTSRRTDQLCGQKEGKVEEMPRQTAQGVHIHTYTFTACPGKMTDSLLCLTGQLFSLGRKGQAHTDTHMSGQKGRERVLDCCAAICFASGNVVVGNMAGAEV